MGNTNEVVAEYVSPEKELVLKVNNYLIRIIQLRHQLSDTKYILKTGLENLEDKITEKKLKLKKTYEDMLYYIEQKKEEIEDPISKLVPLQKDYIQFLEKNIYIYDTQFYFKNCNVELSERNLLDYLDAVEIELRESMYPRN